MTGTGGLLWNSRDLARWTGPYVVTETDPDSWMGPRPMIWAAKLHQYQSKYYYFATFTNREVYINTVRGNAINRRASHVLVSNNPDGPYVSMKDTVYLPQQKPTLDGTFWVDRDGKPYMIFCHEWLQNGNGTMEKIELKPDLSGTIGEGEILFRAHDSPWSRELTAEGDTLPSKVTDGPWLQEPEPITPPNFGHGMLFRTFDGQLLMSVHSHKKVNGRTIRIPHLFEVDDSGDQLIVGALYYPNR